MRSWLAPGELACQLAWGRAWAFDLLSSVLEHCDLGSDPPTARPLRAAHSEAEGGEGREGHGRGLDE
eukprot:15439088-Alexandrium_andersonii.AAC.1